MVLKSHIGFADHQMHKNVVQPCLGSESELGRKGDRFSPSFRYKHGAH